MSIWKGGRITIPVTREHIDRALEKNSSHCVLAEAIKEAIPDAKFVSVDLQTVRWTRGDLRFVCLTPKIAQLCIVHFDQGLREELRPFQLSMRPAFVAKAGKGRGHTPTNRELRGSGLTVAKEQPHLATQRYTANGLRNTDPERVDGLCSPPKPPIRGRARVKISHAHKGSIPCVLGGKMPPTSVLSRREFGLRALRK